MQNDKPLVPFGLPLSGVITIVLGIIANPLIHNVATQEQLDTNVLLSAIPFLLIFIGIILFYMTISWIIASLLNNRIDPTLHKRIENGLIAAIVLSVVAMFQPWLMIAYRVGFHTLLVATLAFITWTHVIPKGAMRQESLSSVSVGGRPESGSD